MKIYACALSTASRMVVAVANYLELEFEYVNVDLTKGEQLTPEFNKLNPNHKVPLLVDGDLVLSESLAILRYLTDKYAMDDALYPPAPQKRALVNMHFGFLNDLRIAMRNLIHA